MDMLTQLEVEIADRLSSLPFFANLTVMVDPTGEKNIVSEIQAKIAKIKTLVAPLVSGGDDNNPNVHGSYFDVIRVSIGIFQNPLIKGNDPVPREIGLEVHNGIKGWTPASLSNVLVPRKPGLEQIADTKLNIWNANFETKGGVIAALPKVATPTSVVAANVTLACATAGAAIFYTTDGSNPMPRNGTLYLAPFVAPAHGTTIKARAFLAGYLNSAQLNLTT